MKIFVLGGYGKAGLAAVRLLTANENIDKITIAGRDRERAKKAAREIGAKASPVQADGCDEAALKTLTAGYDMIINAAALDTVLPCIRAAIHNRAHYCDMAWGEVLAEALLLETEARQARISAVIATGISPCITNLMGVHAARKLDTVEQMQGGRADLFIDFEIGAELIPRQWEADPAENLVYLQGFKPFLRWMLERLQDSGVREVVDFQDGGWVEVDPTLQGIVAPAQNVGTTKAYPYLSVNDVWGMLPVDLGKMTPVEVNFSPLPPALHDLLRKLARQVIEGQCNAEEALNAFFEAIKQDPHRWLVAPEDFIPPVKLWVRAVGLKDGRPARSTCWFPDHMWAVNGYIITSVALVAAARLVLHGEMEERGVMTAEKAFEPLVFFDEVIRLLPDPPPDGKLIEESFEWLD